MVKSLSAIAVLVTMFLLFARLPAPDPEHNTNQPDVFTCVFADLFFGVPLLDSACGTVCNDVNQYRLLE